MTRLLVLLLLPSGTVDQLVQQIVDSGRAVTLCESPSERIGSPPEVAPGQPPLLSFRYLEGKQRGRYANLDLVLDDAGH